MFRAIRRLFGDDSPDVPLDPTQECESCGETYYTDADVRTCLTCGGVKVRRI